MSSIRSGSWSGADFIDILRLNRRKYSVIVNRYIGSKSPIATIQIGRTANKRRRKEYARNQ
jgi:hypothetical protein